MINSPTINDVEIELLLPDRFAAAVLACLCPVLLRADPHNRCELQHGGMVIMTRYACTHSSHRKDPDER